MSALRCVIGNIGPPVFNIFQDAPKIKTLALHVDYDVMSAFNHGRNFWKYGLGGLPNLESIILVFAIPDRWSGCIPGTDPLTWQMDTMTLPGLPELVGATFKIRYKGILCGRPGINCLGTITRDGKNITDDACSLGSLLPMSLSIRKWWKSREAFVTAQEREPKAPTVEICAIWPEAFPKKVKARYASVYSRQGSLF